MQYHIGPLRKFQFLMLPIFAGVFFIAVAYLVTINNPVVDVRIYGVLAVLFAGVSFLPFLFYFNYQKANTDYVLETSEDWFRIRVDGDYHQINYKDIESIEEYNNTKVTPWYYCEYWVVKAEGKEFLITSLLISRNDFFVRFPIVDKLHQNPVFLPFVKLEQ
jgi:hypothetical protein